jgi:hypothetical protein
MHVHCREKLEKIALNELYWHTGPRTIQVSGDGIGTREGRRPRSIHTETAALIVSMYGEPGTDPNVEWTPAARKAVMTKGYAPHNVP